MKKLFGLVCFVLVGCTTSLMGISRPCPCHFTVTGEWVYFSPLIDNPYYAISSTEKEEQLGKKEANDLGFESGFRIQGMYAFGDCCSDVRASWTHLNTGEKTSASSVQLNPTQGYPEGGDNSYLNGTGCSKIDFKFDRVEAVYGLGILNKCCLCMTLEAGVQYTNLEETTRLKYFDDNDNDVFNYKSCYWGVGPLIGLDLNYSVWDCFSVVGVVSSALLIGENDGTDFFCNDGTVEVDLKTDSIWRIVPSFQARAGLNYTFCACLDWSVEVGYEFLTYLDALHSNFWTNDTDRGHSVDYYTNVSFHGPFVSLSASF